MSHRTEFSSYTTIWKYRLQLDYSPYAKKVFWICATRAKSCKKIFALFVDKYLKPLYSKILISKCYYYTVFTKYFWIFCLSFLILSEDSASSRRARDQKTKAKRSKNPQMFS